MSTSAPDDKRDWKTLADQFVTVNEGRIDERISIGDEKKDDETFRKILWKQLHEKYKGTRNPGTTDVFFELSDIRKSSKDGGLGIQEFDEPFIIKTLGKLQREGLVEKLSTGGFRLTSKGISTSENRPL